MQKVILIGRLTRDARVVETQNGNKFVAFTLAVNSKSGGTEKATYYDVRQFSYNERMAVHFTQGSSLVVTGEQDLSIEEKDGKHYLRASVLADSIDFNGGGSQSGSQGEVKVTPVTAIATQTETTKATNTYTEEEEVVVPTVRKVKTVEPVEDTEDVPF